MKLASGSHEESSLIFIIIFQKIYKIFIQYLKVTFHLQLL